MAYHTLQRDQNKIGSFNPKAPKTVSFKFTIDDCYYSFAMFETSHIFALFFPTEKVMVRNLN